jgi:hypothetical protein
MFIHPWVLAIAKHKTKVIMNLNIHKLGSLKKERDIMLT